ncbi:MAG: phage virion morphogenesis protein [Azoarcus sp.]|jgi:phage gpG-like protein|nr:phage virion morphogenesis protein [Azoarcus sp.]
MQYEIGLNTERFDRLLQKLLQAFSSQELLTSFGETLLNANRERHRAGRDPEGQPWKPLKHPNQPPNRRGGPLNRTGRMLQNLHYQVDGDVLQLGFDGGDGRAAKFHQEGSKAHKIVPKNKKALAFMGIVQKRINHPGLPARPLVGFPDADKRLLEIVAENHVKLAANGV